MIPVLSQSESPWQRNDAIPFYLSLCFSVLGKLLWVIASLKNFINLHSAALLQLLHVIWFMPTNFALFKKPLENLFLYTWKSRVHSSINIPYKFQEHWKQGRLLNRASNITNFSPRFFVYKWASSLFTGIVYKFQIPSSHLKTSAYLLLALSWGACNLTSPGRSITWQKDRVKVKRQQSFMYKFIASLIFLKNDRFVWTVSLPLIFEKGKCLHYYPFYVLVRHPWRNLNICFKLSLFCLFEFSHFYCVRHEHCAIPFYNITGLQHHNILSCWTSTFFLLFMWSYPICSSFRLFHGIGCNLFHKVVF